MKIVWIAGMALLAALATAQNELKTQVYATGFTWPVAMAQDPTNPSVQFVVQQRGLIRVVVNGVVQGTNFLNLSGLVNQVDNEGGLLGLAFHPNYASNRQFYVYYTDTSGDTRVVRYLRDAVNPLVADAGSAQQVLFIDQPFSNHNGGTIRFGPLDGYLYIGTGDGGSANDPGNRAQTITNMLLGKMLRIDVDRDDFPADPNKNYGIPATNPFAMTTGDDEIWAFGIRNPWKWTFDNPALLGTGGILIGDVGQGSWEEVDYEPPLMGGRNYGWRVWEGNHTTGLSGGTPPYTFPIAEYSHSVGISITGGYVYRGLALGDYFGKYFYADYGSTRIWTLDLVIDPNTGEGSAANVTERTTDIASGASAISSIDADASGELYIVDFRGSGQGRLLKIVPENRVWVTSAQGLFGAQITGDVRCLSAADGKIMLVGRGLVLMGRLYQSGLQLDMQTDAVAPSFFDVSIDFGASQNFNPGSLDVYMKNWNTGVFDPVGSFPVTGTIQTQQIVGIPAANYRGPGGAVQMQFFGRTTGLLLQTATVMRYERIKVAVR